jgi:hypothetical protein
MNGIEVAADIVQWHEFVGEKKSDELFYKLKSISSFHANTTPWI